MLRIIEKLKEKYWEWQYNKEENDLEDTHEFIWGIKSRCDLSSLEANIHTMNDIEIIYDKKLKKYYMDIETMLCFDDGRVGEKVYVKELFDRLTGWMISKGYDVTKEVWLYGVFTEGYNINTKFDTIEELYANFKFLARGFIEQ